MLGVSSRPLRRLFVLTDRLDECQACAELFGGAKGETVEESLPDLLEDAHARCTVALTLLLGLPGMAQTLASWLHGAHVRQGPEDDCPWQPRRDENQVRGWMEKLAFADRLVWNDIPLAICLLPVRVIALSGKATWKKERWR